MKPAAGLVFAGILLTLSFILFCFRGHGQRAAGQRWAPSGDQARDPVPGEPFQVGAAEVAARADRQRLPDLGLRPKRGVGRLVFCASAA